MHIGECFAVDIAGIVIVAAGVDLNGLDTAGITDQGFKNEGRVGSRYRVAVKFRIDARDKRAG